MTCVTSLLQQQPPLRPLAVRHSQWPPLPKPVPRQSPLPLGHLGLQIRPTPRGGHPGFLLRDRSRAPRDRSRSPQPTSREHPEAPGTAAGTPAFRLDRPADYLYWITLSYQLASGLGTESQQAQFNRLDQSLRAQIAVDSGPLGAAADQPFHVLLLTLSPLFAIWHLTGR